VSTVTTKPRPFVGTHPGRIAERSNVWAAPAVITPKQHGWALEQARRINELSDAFGIEPRYAYLWLGYLNGECHALPEAARR
jgi:hypothetical protein